MNGRSGPAQELTDEFESYTPDEFKRSQKAPPSPPPPQQDPQTEASKASRVISMKSFNELTPRW